MELIRMNFCKSISILFFCISCVFLRFIEREILKQVSMHVASLESKGNMIIFKGLKLL